MHEAADAGGSDNLVGLTVIMAMRLLRDLQEPFYLHVVPGDPQISSTF